MSSASFSPFGVGPFDVPGGGVLTPTWDPATGFVAGPAGGQGAFLNSAVFDVDVPALGARTCGVGECAFAMTDGAGPGIPGEWSVGYFPAVGDPGVVSFGFYEVRVAAIPLPAAGAALLGALAWLGALGARRPPRVA